eukprot:GHVN01019715.1.p1 GENE.GHVN01019715.1~~GHVN01019715.1.p1  ORF type:complete len:663 (-),score=61.24 GHVN01019715.1:1252-3240(-)
MDFETQQRWMIVASSTEGTISTISASGVTTQLVADRTNPKGVGFVVSNVAWVETAEGGQFCMYIAGAVVCPQNTTNLGNVAGMDTHTNGTDTHSAVYIAINTDAGGEIRQYEVYSNSTANFTGAYGSDITHVVDVAYDSQTDSLVVIDNLSIKRINKSDDTFELFTGDSEVHSPWAVTIHGRDVYWTNAKECASDECGSIYKGADVADADEAQTFTPFVTRSTFEVAGTGFSPQGLSAYYADGVKYDRLVWSNSLSGVLDTLPINSDDWAVEPLLRIKTDESQQLPADIMPAWRHPDKGLAMIWSDVSTFRLLWAYEDELEQAPTVLWNATNGGAYGLTWGPYDNVMYTIEGKDIVKYEMEAYYESLVVYDSNIPNEGEIENRLLRGPPARLQADDIAKVTRSVCAAGRNEPEDPFNDLTVMPVSRKLYGTLSKSNHVIGFTEDCKQETVAFRDVNGDLQGQPGLDKIASDALRNNLLFTQKGGRTVWGLKSIGRPPFKVFEYNDQNTAVVDLIRYEDTVGWFKFVNNSPEAVCLKPLSEPKIDSGETCFPVKASSGVRHAAPLSNTIIVLRYWGLSSALFVALAVLMLALIAIASVLLCNCCARQNNKKAAALAATQAASPPGGADPVKVGKECGDSLERDETLASENFAVVEDDSNRREA